MSEFVTTEVHDGVATIRLNRPPMNPISLQVQTEFADAAQQVAANP